MISPLVTQVLWKLDRGGVERMVFALAKALPRYGFRVRVVAAGGGGIMEQEFRAADIPLVTGPSVGPYHRVETVRFLRQELRAHHPTIFHTHLGGDVWGGLAAHLEGVHPWISTVHDVQTPPLLKGLVRGYALRAANHVVCISDHVRRHVAAMYHRTGNVSVIRLGVPSVPDIRSLRIERRLQRFVVIGRLVPGKRVDVLIQALASIQEPWRLDVVGDGPERGRLEEMVRALKIRPRVRFTGSVEDVSPFLAAADACLCASREEGQGMGMLEAAAAGLPIITSDLPVLRECFDEYSLTFVPQDADARVWGEVMQEGMYAPHELHIKAHEAQMIVRRLFSLERMVEEYGELYQKMIQK